jgi:hypothetical protein
MCLQELQEDKLSHWTPGHEGPSLRGGSGVSLWLEQGYWMKWSQSDTYSLNTLGLYIQSSSLLSFWSQQSISLKINFEEVKSSEGLLLDSWGCVCIIKSPPVFCSSSFYRPFSQNQNTWNFSNKCLFSWKKKHPHLINIHYWKDWFNFTCEMCPICW